jgi:hypothetical protein
MPRDLEILTNEKDGGWLFRSSHSPLDFRLIICRSLLHHLRQHPSADVPETLTRAIQAMERGQAFDDVADLFRLYPVGSGGSKGYAVVDSTGGCYPLLLYAGKPPHISTEDYRLLRVDLFLEALETIRDRWLLIKRLLQGPENAWTAPLQDRLLGQLPAPARDAA